VLRVVLTEVGELLLADARAVTFSLIAMKARAQSMTSGIEADYR
jgi:hypothetical protein